MPKYRNCLPQLEGDVFLTDGGLETELLFHQGWDLPCFAAFDLLRRQGGEEALERYFATYAEVARQHGVGIVLESATWRASSDWGRELGYSDEELAEANRRSIELMTKIREAYETPETRIVLSGCIGPRGDGYDPGDAMSPDEAGSYHARQIAVLSDTEADLVSALTITNASEAIGIVRAAEATEMPVVISFTVETDGGLPTGQSLAEAITEVDEATGSYPAYYMLNCAHPTHFGEKLRTDAEWVGRVRGLRANASRLSHAELDEATELDTGDPEDLARHFRFLTRRLPHLNVVGGCCGTDHRHIAEIAGACAVRLETAV